MKKILLIIILIPIWSFSQQLKLDVTILDQDNRGIDNASVVVSDIMENILIFKRTDSNGYIQLLIDKKLAATIKIEISNLGYLKKEVELDLNTIDTHKFSFVLQEDREMLKEVVLMLKIRVDSLKYLQGRCCIECLLITTE